MVFYSGTPHTSHFGHGQRKMWLCWVHFWLVWGPEGGPLGSQIVELGCQDTDWVGGNEKRGFRWALTPGRDHTNEKTFIFHLEIASFAYCRRKMQSISWALTNFHFLEIFLCFS